MKQSFREWLRKAEENGNQLITEIIKGPVQVHWPKGFGKGTGYFNVEDEKYEIEFDIVDTNHCTIRGMKFFRIIDNNRKIKYTASKEPYCVSSTVKEQVQKYIEHFKPDIFGYMGNLEEKPRLRHYLRMIQDLEKKFKFYNDVFTRDEGGERIFVLSKFESNKETLDNLIELRKELGKV